MRSHRFLTAPLRFLADKDPVTKVPPKELPGHLGNATDTLIGWTITGALIACVLGFLGGGALLGMGQLTERPDAAARGKRAMTWACISAALVGAVWALVNSFYNIAQ